MPQADGGQVVAAVVLAAIVLWLIVKAIQAAGLATRKAALAAKREAVFMPIKIDLTLNTPVKRLGACLAAAGLASTAIGAIQIAFQARYFWEGVGYFLESALWLISFRGHLEFKAVAYGVPLTLIGLGFSFFYDIGVGKVIRWIIHGRNNVGERGA